MKDCAFQYATSNGYISEDTGLISRVDADDLWKKYIPKFKSDVEDGKNPEMAIWVDMSSDTNYIKTAIHWCGEDFIIKDDEMYQIIRIP